MGELASTVANDTQWATFQVETELGVIFGDSGRQVVLKEVGERYGVSLEDAITRPSAFREALFYLLGDLGTSLVMGRINKRVLGVATPPTLNSGAL